MLWVPVILLWVATNTNTGKWVTRPGTWETDGPAMANRPCTWSRRSDLTGDLSSIIDTGVVKSGQRERVALKLGE